MTQLIRVKANAFTFHQMSPKTLQVLNGYKCMSFGISVKSLVTLRQEIDFI